MTTPPHEIMAEGRYLRLVREGQWEYAQRVHSSGAVMIVAVTAEGRLLLVQQYRVPHGQDVIELPAGIAGDEPQWASEPLEQAARRELEEETGYQADSMRLLTAGPTSAGLSTEMVSLFLAEGLRRTGPGGGDSREQIHVHEVPLTEIHSWLEVHRKRGVLVDARIYAGLHFIQQSATLGGRSTSLA